MSGGTNVCEGEVEERFVEVNGHPCRIWSKGDGPALVYLAGIGGLPRWTSLLDRLAQQRRVIAPSMPGHPGSLGHDVLDSHLDWLVALGELLELAAEPEADLMGVSIGAGLAADLVAMSTRRPSKLVLVAPLGLYAAEDPITDIWAQRPGATPALLCHHPQAYVTHTEPPTSEGEDPAAAEWEIRQVRAATAEARILWPLGDVGLGRRLHRVRCSTLLVWGEHDQVISPTYAARYAEQIGGQAERVLLPGAGHLVDLDVPDRLGEAVLHFLGR